MTIDAQTLFSDAQAVTASAASANVLDLGVAGRSSGHPLALFVLCAETATAEGAATVTVQLQTDDNADFSSARLLLQTATIPKAELIAGQRLFLGTVPAGAERFLRLFYSVASGPLTAGRLSAGLALDLQTA